MSTAESNTTQPNLPPPQEMRLGQGYGFNVQAAAPSLRDPAEVIDTIGFAADVRAEMTLAPDTKSAHELWIVRVPEDTVVGAEAMPLKAGFYAVSPGGVHFSKDPALQRGFALLPAGKSKIGRSPESPTQGRIDFKDQVSRQHVEVTIPENQAYITVIDRSTNGTQAQWNVVPRPEREPVAAVNEQTTSAEVLPPAAAVAPAAGAAAVAPLVGRQTYAEIMDGAPVTEQNLTAAELLKNADSLAAAIEAGDRQAQELVRTWLTKRQAEAVGQVWDRWIPTMKRVLDESSFRDVVRNFNNLAAPLAPANDRLLDDALRLAQQVDHRGSPTADFNYAAGQLTQTIYDTYPSLERAMAGQGPQTIIDTLRTVSKQLELEAFRQDPSLTTAAYDPDRSMPRHLAEQHRKTGETHDTTLETIVADLRDSQGTVSDLIEQMHRGLPDGYQPKAATLRMISRFGAFLGEATVNQLDSELPAYGGQLLQDLARVRDTGLIDPEMAESMRSQLGRFLNVTGYVRDQNETLQRLVGVISGLR